MGNKPSTSEEGTEILREYNDILKGRRKISTTVSWDTSTIDIRGMRQKIFQLQKGISQMKKFHLYKIHNSSAEIFFRQKCCLWTCFTINSGQHNLWLYPQEFRERVRKNLERQGTSSCAEEEKIRELFSQQSHIEYRDFLKYKYATVRNLNKYIYNIYQYQQSCVFYQKCKTSKVSLSSLFKLYWKYWDLYWNLYWNLPLQGHKSELPELLTELFESVDDGDGLLTREELVKLEAGLGRNITLEEAADIIQTWDSDGDGNLTVEEFIEYKTATMKT